LSVPISTLENEFPARLWHLVRRDQVHGVLGGVLLLPELQHSFAHRTIAQPGVRHDVPAEGLRDQIGGHLPVSQGAVVKVPQWTFARYRLLDDQHVADAAQKCRV
jgi:hypothetical protein